MKALAQLCSVAWPIAKHISHEHKWRLLTAKDDYGAFGRHWGGYGGCDQEECVLCGELRTVPYHVTEAREKNEKDAAAIYNLSEKGIEHWRRRSLKNDGPIMIYDDGTVTRLEFGTVFNGESQVLSSGHGSRKMEPMMIFRRGELVTRKQLNGDAPANPIGQAHLNASQAGMSGSGFVPYDGD